jgi:hypothetical protein
MKTNNLKWIAYALSALMLLQSCRVYHSNTSTLDEVESSHQRVKIKTVNGEKYVFDWLQIEDDQIIGVAKLKSRTAEKLLKQKIEGKLVGDYLKYLLEKNTIKEYHLQDKTMSTLLSVGIPVFIIGAIIGWTAIALSSGSLFSGG